MKRFCRYIKKIVWMKCRLLTSKIGVTGRPGRLHSLKKHQRATIQINLKKAPGSPEFIDDQSKEGQSPKKVSGSGDGQKTATKTGKKVKKTPETKKAPKPPKSDEPKKAPKSPEFFHTGSNDSGTDDEQKPKKG